MLAPPSWILNISYWTERFAAFSWADLSSCIAVQEWVRDGGGSNTAGKKCKCKIFSMYLLFFFFIFLLFTILHLEFFYIYFFSFCFVDFSRINMHLWSFLMFTLFLNHVFIQHMHSFFHNRWSYWTEKCHVNAKKIFIYQICIYCPLLEKM